MYISFFFFNDTATTEIYTLSLHDALPIYAADQGLHSGDVIMSVGGKDVRAPADVRRFVADAKRAGRTSDAHNDVRSEEHTSELQSPDHLVCRLLLEKKKLRAIHELRTNLP